MKHHYRTAVIAVGALFGLAGSQAFADLDRVAQDDAPQSWFINLSAQIGSSGLTGPFDTIKAFIDGPVTYTINSQTYTISTPSLFEDISSSGGHKAIQGFTIMNPSATSTWAQTGINSTPGGTTLTAAGNSFSTSGEILNFNLFFTGAQTDGTHFFLEFWNGASFVTGYEIKDVIVTGTAHPDGFEQTNYSQSVLVPLPSSAWIGGIGMLGMIGATLFRRSRSRRVLL